MLTFSYRNKKESTVLRRIIRIAQKIFGLNPVRSFAGVLAFMEHTQIDIRTPAAALQVNDHSSSFSQAGDTRKDFRSVFVRIASFW